MLNRKHRRATGSEDRTVLGLITLLVVLFIVFGVNSGFVSGLFAAKGETLRATFTDTGALKRGDKVRVDGVDVGLVKEISLDAGGRGATVRMAIQDDAPTLRADARAAVRWKTVLGGTAVVDLDPGSATRPALAGGRIPVRRTTSQIEIDQALAFYRPDAKRGLQRTLHELPRALAAPAAPAKVLATVDRIAPDTTRALSAVRGRAELDLRRLVGTADRTVRALDAPQEQLRRTIGDAAAVLGTTASQREALRSTVALAGTIQPRLRANLAAVSRTLSVADPVIARLRGPAADVAPTLRDLRPTVTGASRLLRDARPLIRNLRPAATSLADAARDARPLLDELDPSLQRLDERILPDLAEKDDITKLRTYEMVGPVLASLNGSASTFDTEGHLFRFPALAGERVLSDDLPCATYLTDPSRAEILACDDLGSALQSYTSFLANPFPKVSP